MKNVRPSKEQLIQKMRASQEASANDSATRERDERAIPIAIFILKTIANHPDLAVTLGSNRDDEAIKKFLMDLQLTIVTEFTNKNVLLKDASYIFRLAHQAVDDAQDMMKMNIEENTTRAERYKWGVDPMQISFQDLHAVLLEAEAAGTAEEAIIKAEDEARAQYEKDAEADAAPEVEEANADIVPEDESTDKTVDNSEEKVDEGEEAPVQ